MCTTSADRAQMQGIEMLNEPKPLILCLCVCICNGYWFMDDT